MSKHWREVRSQRGNKLLFRFCAESDSIEIKTPAGEIEIVSLDELRPSHLRRQQDEVKEVAVSGLTLRTSVL